MKTIYKNYYKYKSTTSIQDVTQENCITKNLN